MVQEITGAPGGGRGFATSRGSVTLWEPSPKLLVMRFVGYAEAPLAARFVERMDRFALDNQGFWLFIDLETLGGYDSEIRTRATASASAFIDRTAQIDFLVGSKLVGMGVSVANLALGGRLNAHTERRSFVSALDGACRSEGISGFTRKVGLDAPPPTGTGD